MSSPAIQPGSGPSAAASAGRAPAFKEWAVIVRALLAGEQILDVRKGGIKEAGRHFSVRARRVWLYPTTEHQRADLLKPAYRRWIADSERDAPAEGTLRIEGWADIGGVAKLTEPDQLARIDGKFIWTGEYAASRLHWKSRDPLWVLAMRAYRLLDPVVIPWRPEYGGCTSWVDLTDLPDDPATLASEPALADGAFAARVKYAANDLPAGFEEPTISADQGEKE